MRRIASIVALALVLSISLTGESEKSLIKKLPPHYRDWLTRDVAYIITPVEKEVFLKLETDREREVYISAFWKQRDPNPNFPENEFKKEHYRRIEYANKWLGRESPTPGWRTDMGRIYITLGEPKNIEKFVNETELCPTEVWFYQGMGIYGLPDSFNVVFFKEDGVGEFILYTPIRFGPHTLLRNYEGDRLDYVSAVNQLAGIQPKVAEVSMTLISGEPMSTPSLASEMLVREKIPLAPQKKVNNIYATKFLKYKGIVEVEYADNYIDNSAQFNLFQDRSGHSFIHYLIEPSRLTFDQYEGQYFTTLDISGNISDKKGKMITQIKRKLPLKLSQEMMGKVKDKLFSFQDLIPIIPGEHRISLIVKSSSGMEFTSVEKNITVKAPAEPSISKLLLGNRLNHMENAALYKPYCFEGEQILTSPRNDFTTDDELQIFFQVYQKATKKKSGSIELRVDSKLATVWSVHKPLSEFSTLPNVRLSTPLKTFSPAYYTVEVILYDENKNALARENENFFVTPQTVLPRPWVVSQPLDGYGEVLHELARQNLEMGRIDLARSLLEEGLQKQGDDPVMTLDYCKLLTRLEQYDRVKELALPMLKEKNRYEFTLVLGEISQKQGIYDEAISYYADFLTHFGAQPDVFNRIAECYIKLELPEEALKAYKKSLEIESRQSKIKEEIKRLESELKK